MSGQTGLEEAARLEAALARIARASARRAGPPVAHAALHDAASRAKEAASGTDTTVIAATLDALIAELHALLGPQDF